MVCDDSAIDASAFGRSKLQLLARKHQGKLLGRILGRGEEEEGRSVAECKRRGQRCQSEGTDQCLRHDAVIAGRVLLLVMFTLRELALRRCLSH